MKQFADSVQAIFNKHPQSADVALEPTKGILILNVVDGVIAKVEILHRNEIRQKLLGILP